MIKAVTWKAKPRRLKFWPIRDDQQHRQSYDPLENTTNQLQACWISPERVFEDHQDWLRERKRLDLSDKRLQGLFPTLLRIIGQRRVTPVIGKR
jgi:hypothetical protein